MKKGILVFATIFLVLLFFLAPAVDAGVGNSESGGSSLIDSGGGSSWSGGDSWYNLVKGTDDTISSSN